MFHTFKELFPRLQSLYEYVKQSHHFKDYSDLPEYEETINALMNCRPVMSYFNHITPEEWSDMGLESMSTLRGVAEEIVKSFLDDSLALGSPVAPLKHLEEFFDNKTIIYSVRVEFLADKLPQEIEEEIDLDGGAVMTIERLDGGPCPLYICLRRKYPLNSIRSRN